MRYSSAFRTNNCIKMVLLCHALLIDSRARNRTKKILMEYTLENSVMCEYNYRNNKKGKNQKIETRTDKCWFFLLKSVCFDSTGFFPHRRWAFSTLIHFDYHGIFIFTPVRFASI